METDGRLPSGSTGQSTNPLRQLADTVADKLTPHWIGSPETGPVLILEIPLGSYEPVLVARPDSGVSPLAAAEDMRLSVVLGSGFVSHTHALQPVGLLQEGGVILSPLQIHGYTRILGINDEGFGVVHRSEYQPHLFHSALQAGPGIIEAGKLDISERDLRRPKYYRSFLAICADAALAGISTEPTHLRTLGQSLIQFFDQKSMSCDEVVNLAGDRQAVLVARRDNGEYLFHGDIHNNRVSMIGFRSAPRH